MGRRECRHHASPAFMCLNFYNADKHSFCALLPGRVTLGLVRGSLRHALHHQALELDWCMGYLEQRRQ